MPSVVWKGDWPATALSRGPVWEAGSQNPEKTAFTSACCGLDVTTRARSSHTLPFRVPPTSRGQWVVELGGGVLAPTPTPSRALLGNDVRALCWGLLTLGDACVAWNQCCGVLPASKGDLRQGPGGNCSFYTVHRGAQAKKGCLPTLPRAQQDLQQEETERNAKKELLPCPRDSSHSPGTWRKFCCPLPLCSSTFPGQPPCPSHFPSSDHTAFPQR